MTMQNKGVIALVISGNLLDYFDFMLFVHVGSVLTGVFFPGLDPVQTHLLSLLLTAIPLFVRPLGGYFFGKISDTLGRGLALGKTLKIASIASLGIALLPGYEIGGVISALLFIFFRGMQGLSLGGEYTTAGTLLMEKYENHRGFLSGIAGASGTLGSLIAFGFAWFYLNGQLPDYAWRVAFGAGALVTYLSYYFREKLKRQMTGALEIKPFPTPISPFRARLITLLIGLYIGVLLWIPTIYSNFYLTKILNYPMHTGLTATLIALIGSVVFTPLAGMLADRIGPEKQMTLAALLTLPLSIGGFMMVQAGNLWGQVLMIISVALFGAPMHAVMNPLFVAQTRSRTLNTAFTLGASIGGLVPLSAGILAAQGGIHEGPILFILLFGTLTFWVFYTSFKAKPTF